MNTDEQMFYCFSYTHAIHTDTTAMPQANFIAACECGDLAQAKTELTKPGVHVDRRYSAWGYTALGRTCMQGHLAVVQWLVEDEHADINVPNLFGTTPFWFACYRNRLAIAKWLAAHGANVCVANMYGETPFWVACWCGNLEIVRWLAITVGVGGDVMRAPVSGNFKGGAPFEMARRFRWSAVASWLAPFLQRRVLIAYWGAGRDRCRAGLPCLGCQGRTSKEAVWRLLPREALAGVLLMLGSR